MDVSKYLQVYVKHINKILYKFIKQKHIQNTSLVQAMLYSTLLGGKRLRPFLVYATGKMFNVNRVILDILAASVEYIHAYSLIHDDLPAMDNDNYRRNLPSCHTKFGEANAILAGNALQALAFEILSSAPMNGLANNDRLIMIFYLAKASGATGMCEGQSLDIATKKNQINLKEIEHIYQKKTGELIRVAVHLGTLSAGQRGRQALAALDCYAKNIGLAFQIQDDILDILRNRQLSNHQHKKQSINKKTYPIFGIKNAKKKTKNLIIKARQALQPLTSKSLNISVLESLANYIIQRDK